MCRLVCERLLGVRKGLKEFQNVTCLILRRKKCLPLTQGRIPPLPQLTGLRDNVDLLQPAGVGALWPLLKDQPLHQKLDKVLALGLLEGREALGVPGSAILLNPDQGRLGLRQRLNGLSIQRDLVAVNVDGRVILRYSRN